MKRIGSILFTVVSILIGMAIVRGVMSYYQDATNTNDPATTSATEFKNLGYKRSTYVSSCGYYARQSAGADVDQSVIDNYCGCVYDRGVALWGVEEFTNQDIELSETNVVTPEMNDIVNACVEQAYAAEEV